MTEFEKIYTEHFQGVYLYILRLSGNKAIAEDITSETFFKAMHSLRNFRGECELRVWLCQIAKNCYFSHQKRQSKLESLDDDSTDLVSTDDPLDEQFMDQEHSQQIRQQLHTIPEPYKEVFMWRVFGDLSFKQIAQIFKKTDNWACVTYHRARKMIIHGLEEAKNEK